MKIWVYTLTYNEKHFVGNFLTAYKDAERIIVYDNYSTDNTVERLLKDSRVTVKYFDTNCQIRDDIYLDIKNNCWKEAKGEADWVIVVDFDEIFTRFPELDLDLTPTQDYTIIKPYGYNMISMDAPLYTEYHPWEWSQKGTYHEPAEKLCCFRPDKITEINYAIGAHTAKPEGDVKIYYSKEYRLLHYKAWNYNLYMEKAELCRNRLSDVNKRMGWGFQYLNTEEQNKNMYLAGIKLAKPIIEL